jgi:hypothetical protein
LIVSNPNEDNPAFVTDCNDPGFAAIGTGSYLADSTLYAFNQSFMDSLAATIYKTLFAKFVAESASDVGEATYLYVFSGDGSKMMLDDGLVGKVRDRWVAHGKPSLDVPTLGFITEAIRKLGS